jgi:hypothetical protein
MILVQSIALDFGPLARNPPSPEYEDRAELLLDDRTSP